MTTEREFDRDLGNWLDELSTRSIPEDLLARSLARVAITRQRPGWLVRDRGQPPRAMRRPRGRWLLVAATVAVGTGVIGASLVGGRLVTPKPAPTFPVAVTNPTPAPSSSPSEAPSAVAMKAAVFAFNKRTGTPAECGDTTHGGCISRLWVANLDGTGEHELLPDQVGCQRVQAWSPDGTRLLFSRSDCRLHGENGMTGVERFYLTDASGSEPQLVDTGCVSPCMGEDDAVFSSDGREVLFVRTVSVPVSPSATPDPVTGKPASGTEVRVLASIDLGTGRVTELGGFDECYQSCEIQSPRSYPLWSPDRTQIAYTWEGTRLPGPQPPGDPAVYVADADGRNAHRVSAFGGLPGWSPDGARLVFQGIQYSWTGTWFPGKVIRSSSDIYSVRPDGTDRRQLTTDGSSWGPRWGLDGRIWFMRGGATDGPDQNWVMDADGGNAAHLSLPPQPQELADAARQPMP